VTTNRHEWKVEWAAKARRAEFSRRLLPVSTRGILNSGSGGQIVAMMQTAKFWHRYDSSTRFRVTHCFAASRRSLVQGKMSSVLVVITDVLIHEAFQMPFVENDHMVEQISAAVPDPTFSDTVLPWASEAGPLGLDAEALLGFDHFFIELCAVIEDQITRRRIIRECLAQLLSDPGARRMPGHVAVEDAPPIMRNDEKAVKNAEGERRHGEEVHRGNRFAMVVQKSYPSLCRLGIAGRFSHPAQHGSFRNIETKHLQLAVDARRAPGGVVGDHVEDQLAQFFSHALSSRTVPMARKPSPVEPEPRPMPANDSLRLDEDHCRFPSRPKPPQDHPEYLVRSGKAGLRMLLFQNGELLTKGQILQEEVAARTPKPNKKIEQELQRTEHEPVVAEAPRISMQNLLHRDTKPRSKCGLFRDQKAEVQILSPRSGTSIPVHSSPVKSPAKSPSSAYFRVVWQSPAACKILKVQCIEALTRKNPTSTDPDREIRTQPTERG